MKRLTSTLRRTLVALMAVATVMTAAPNQQAQAASHGPFGLGFILGSPVGFTGKVYFSDMIALDFAAGVAWYRADHFQTHLDVTFQFDLKKWPKGALDLYFGLGPKIGWWYWDHRDDFQFGMRFPVGVTFELESHPVEFFFEVAPGGWFLQGRRSGFDIDGGIGARWFF